MRRTTTTLGSASAAVLCLGVLLTGCGSAADEGYVAVGAAGPADGRAPTKPVPPREGVALTPLDGQGDRSGTGDRGGHGAHGGRGGHGDAGDSSGNGDGSDRDGGTGTGRPTPSTSPTGARGDDHTHPNPPSAPGSSAPRPPGSPGPSAPAEPPSPTIPAGPGARGGLLVGAPVRSDTDVRWCERVTLDFLNTGDAPVTAGTVTFGTHIIGALGIDWATITSRHALPLPLPPGKRRTGSWRVCVDAWRVPLGMHIDTEDVAFTWKRS
ncbi:hypothetical protein AB0C96_00505 [Streptomyces sp. NPDC048506]|uniref:hypothetical protein n=1 Tax=Streptomyces sp. NPDC048506 TaxID=3155028 RepID=UPI003413C726